MHLPRRGDHSYFGCLFKKKLKGTNPEEGAGKEDDAKVPETIRM